MNHAAHLMRRRYRWGAAVLGIVLMQAVMPGGVLESVWAEQQPPVVEEFVPFDGVPEADQIPAVRVLVAAYSAVWILAFGYVWSVWRRLSAIEKDLSELSRRMGE